MKSHKYILIYYIGYVTIKAYLKMCILNPLYFSFWYLDGYFEEINKNKYLTLVPTNESKEKIKKHEELGIKIGDSIRPIIENSDDYGYDKKYIKIKFYSDDELPLYKMIEIPIITIVARAIFLKNNYYSQVFLNECLYKI